MVRDVKMCQKWHGNAEKWGKILSETLQLYTTYVHAHKAWKAYGCKNMGDYHILYNDLDVLPLADVFENFRDICIKNYNLDPAHYYTTSGSTWDAALKVRT